MKKDEDDGTERMTRQRREKKNIGQNKTGWKERSDSEAVKKMRDKNTDRQQAATGILSFPLTQNVKK